MWETYSDCMDDIFRNVFRFYLPMSSLLCKTAKFPLNNLLFIWRESCLMIISIVNKFQMAIRNHLVFLQTNLATDIAIRLLWGHLSKSIFFLKGILHGGTLPGDTLQIFPLAQVEPPNPSSITSLYYSLTHCVGFFRGIQFCARTTKDNNWNCNLDLNTYSIALSCKISISTE